ncbi:MAG: Smr/MutS family protein [Verrucomicrobiales bacterium]|nr:Smr/MutS family protein [Verrucomicrobiales bacterium]
MTDAEPPEPVDLPIDGVLDLHTFRPRDVKSVVLDYLELCRERDILEVRVIHGKGRGVLRQTVRSLLEQHPEVVSFSEASLSHGGWGATVVHLRPSGGAVARPPSAR